MIIFCIYKTKYMESTKHFSPLLIQNKSFNYVFAGCKICLANSDGICLRQISYRIYRLPGIGFLIMLLHQLAPCTSIS